MNSHFVSADPRKSCKLLLNKNEFIQSCSMFTCSIFTLRLMGLMDCNMNL